MATSRIPRRASYALDDGGRAHAAAGAHGDEAGAEVAPFELVQHRADEHAARRPDGMTEGHGPAVDVALVPVDLRVAQELQHHRREGLVDFDEVDVVER